jgi:hypothetical protein
MPIRLNLLAEAQAAEEMRRKDPVKRALFIAALLVVLLLVWASSLQLKAIIANKELGSVLAQINTKSNDYKQVIETQKKVLDITEKLFKLHSLATNRFLNGDLLNALQRTTVDDVQLTRLKVEQLYSLTERTKARTNGTKVIAGTPDIWTEKVVLTLDGHDSSASPGDQVTRYKDALATNSYFQESLGKTNQVNLKNISAPQVDPASGRAIVLFNIECRYPEKTR